jgi:UDP-N-acetylglucosamine 4,6-dehydratase
MMEGGEIFIPKIPSMKIVDLAKAVAPECRIKTIGIRPGEKLHETLIPVDDAKYTVEARDMFITCPEVIFSEDRKKVKGDKLSDSFKGYTSDNNNRWLSISALRGLLKKIKE